MNPFPRRSILSSSVGAAGGLAAAAIARAQGVLQPAHQGVGASDPGPRDPVRDAENPDILNPPLTDQGTLPNLRFSFADSHMRQTDGGWTRQITQRELGVSTTIAGVNMRLKAGGTRELHWHKEGEWSYMLYGSARITAVDQNGRNFVDDVHEGDLWYFPSGVPHSIQGLNDDGCEFLLVFDDGSFNEESTFLLNDWFRHIPPEVLGKNFGQPASMFGNTPPEERRYIFALPVPGALDADRIEGNGRVPESFSYRLLQQAPQKLPHGQVRIVDSTNFKASKTISAALVEVEPGGMRELHWHPNAAEWQYYLAGEGRMGVFASGGNARTFDFRAGDVGYVPFAMGHYIENIGSSTLRFLEMFRSPTFADISLNQWLALTPRELVQGHLDLGDQFTGHLDQTKHPVV
ncbi:oxalate decarboxylase family bicupin [Lichenicoccus sp.]|uniref:oxalate decarboxylase family bicupin n=1 Tax=Lichenicoccus sp. TaxID=2781899 RepID=UPI003D0B2512